MRIVAAQARIGRDLSSTKDGRGQGGLHVAAWSVGHGGFSIVRGMVILSDSATDSAGIRLRALVIHRSGCRKTDGGCGSWGRGLGACFRRGVGEIARSFSIHVILA
jgi:hypothetical protein